jgi:hypothetical protein
LVQQNYFKSFERALLMTLEGILVFTAFKCFSLADYFGTLIVYLARLGLANEMVHLVVFSAAFRQGYNRL